MHNTLSVCEHEALVCHTHRLCHPICDIIAALAGKHKQRWGGSKQDSNWFLCSQRCLPAVAWASRDQSQNTTAAAKHEHTLHTAERMRLFIEHYSHKGKNKLSRRV